MYSEINYTWHKHDCLSMNQIAYKSRLVAACTMAEHLIMPIQVNSVRKHEDAACSTRTLHFNIKHLYTQEKNSMVNLSRRSD